MKGYNLGYQDQSFSFVADISVGVPESGFLLQIGQSGNDYFPNVSFSGVSGYLFDASGNFFGGYQKNIPFSLSGNFFFSNSTGRYSYYYNNVLVANNIYGFTGFVDNVRFEDYGGLNTSFVKVSKENGSPIVFADSNGVYLVADGFYLSAGNN